MPIKSDNADVIIPFEYEDNKSGQKYYLRYHYHNNIPSVSVSDDQKEWVPLPAAMFVEIADFLKDKGVIEGAKKTPEPKKVQENRPVQPPVNTTVVVNRDVEEDDLVLPEIDGEVEGDVEDGGVEQPEPMEVAEVEPLTTFAGMEELADKVSTAKPKVAAEEEEEIISRPVIRTNNETEAAILRGGNKEKSIKRTSDS